MCSALVQSDLWHGPIDLAALRDGAPHPVAARAPAWCDEPLPRPPVVFVGVAGKLAKLAEGVMMTHFRRSKVDTGLFGTLAVEAEARPAGGRGGDRDDDGPALLRRLLETASFENLCFQVEIH